MKTKVHRLKDMTDVMLTIAKQNAFINRNSEGATGIIYHKGPDRYRTIIQVLFNFRIFKHEIIDERSLVIYNMLSEFSRKGATVTSTSSAVYLTDIKYVAIGENGSKFITDRGIDFAFSRKDYKTRYDMVKLLVKNEDIPLQYYWATHGCTLNNVIEDMRNDIKAFESEKNPIRPLGMHCDF